MHIPKKYGQSKVDKCPFCQKHATSMNRQNVPVCFSHKNEVLDNLKCVCGSTLEVLHGKFGAFFSCIKCGNMNLKKVMEFNAITAKTKEPKNPNLIPSNDFENKKIEKYNTKKTITVRSDDPRYFD